MSEKKSYESLKNELEQIMSLFESSSHKDVDEMLTDYEKASNLIKEIDSYLTKAEVSLKKLKAK